MATSLTAVIIVIMATVLGAFGALLLKIGSKKAHFDSGLFKNFHLITGLMFYAVSSVFFIIALRHGDLSVLYPVVSFSYIWVSLLSVKFLHEKMNKWKWTGIALIILGVSLVGIGG